MVPVHVTASGQNVRNASISGPTPIGLGTASTFVLGSI
jgi:hypothetical protein